MKFLKVEKLTSGPGFVQASLNRPEVKNAFHPEMIQELTEFFKQASHDKSIKAIVLKGEGTAFCAGADLNWMKEMVDYTFDQNVADSQKLWEMFEAIAFCETPVIGIAHGAVFGGALGLLACCDYVFAEEKTQFCFSEVKLGLAPAVISSFVARKSSDGHFRPLMLSAEVFSTEKAEAIGLAHKTFNGELDLATALKNFFANGTEAMRETKKLLNEISTATWSEQKVETTKIISQRRISPEGQERLKKFVEKK